MRRAPLLTLVVLGVSAAALPARAREEYASCTGRPCAHCHESPGGGGTLTAAGEAFGAAVVGPREQAPSPALRSLFGGVLFLHIATAFIWFGTILYVHLILKPAAIARGLPKTEVRVGRAGVILVALTGTVLTLHRIHSWQDLFHTRFGVLLATKIALFAMMATTAVLVTVFIRPRLGRRRDGGPQASGGELTLEALSSFDGQEDRPTFVSYQGKVFDLSRSREWRHGVHNARHHAGADLTEAMAQAPHSPDRLKAFPEVGKLVPATTARPLPERAFFFMAYLNLGIVAAVLLVIALWRS